ncbi:MAG TPA: rod shape-determining protein RodA [Clostridia bacterium]
MYSVEKTRGQNPIKQFDFTLFVLVLILSAVGMLVLSSATMTMPSGSRLMMTQSVGLGLGIILSVFICSIDYKDFKSFGFILYLGSIVLLVLVLFVGTGDKQNGARSWFNLGVFRFQPSELAKISFIIIASVFFERIQENKKWQDIVKLIVYFMIPAGLILAENDFGTTMVVVFAFCVMAFVSGLSYKYFIYGLGASLLSIPLMWRFFLKPYQKDRIMVFLNPDLDHSTKGYQVFQAKTAISTGQLFGKGLFSGPQTQNGLLPVKESDFIYAVIGEELGLIGTLAIVLLIVIILLRCIHIAKNSRDSYGTFLVIGISSVLAFHFIENIGMCIGLMPVTGIPLPFVSSGGSSMLTNFIGIGIILSVSMRRKKVIFNSSQ